MSKLAETNALIDMATILTENGIESSTINQAIMLDMAKSLAMIADKICKSDKSVAYCSFCGAKMEQEGKNTNGN